MLDVQSLPHRPCVGVMLINRDGLVWTGKRDSGPEHVDATHSWQMPQGGIDEGEVPLDAARRELFEETCVKSVSLLAEAPDWYAYDLPAPIADQAWKGKYRGQTQKWFAFRFDGADSEIDVINLPHGHTVEFSQWRWEKAENLPELIIPFKRPVYEKVVAAFSEFTA